MQIDKTNDTIIIKRPAALLDIDHTIICSDSSGRDMMNDKLFTMLLAHNIKDVYFFTDMIFSFGQIEERLNIIRYVERAGYTVHGCITPLDYFWNFPIESLKKFEEAFSNNRICLRENAEKNLDKIPELLKAFPFVQDCINNNTYPDICVAFNDVSRQPEPLTAKQLEEFNLRSHYCKIVIDIVSQLKHLTSAKGIMCKQFQTNAPAWVSDCYVFDDKIEHINAAKACGVYTIHGEFSHKLETFTKNFQSSSTQLSPSISINRAIIKAFQETKTTLEAKAFGAIYKKDLELAEAFQHHVVFIEDNFDLKWQLIREHLRKIMKNFFGYQFSVFDTKLLLALANEVAICDKLGVHLDNKKAAQDASIILPQFLVAHEPHPPLKTLHASVDSGINMPRLSLNNKKSRVSTAKPQRFRASSDAPKPVTMSTESIEMQSQTKK